MSRDVTIKGKYSWVKHIDFMLLDIVCLVASFLLAFQFYLGDVSEGMNENWMQFVAILVFVDLVITFMTSPYSGILRKPGYVIVVRTMKQAVYILFLATVVFYLLKSGSDYSRVTFVVMLLIYMCLSSVVKYVWKKVIERLFNNSKSLNAKPILVVCEKIPTEEYLKNIEVGDRQDFHVQAVYIYPQEDGTEIPETIGAVPVLPFEGGYKHYVLSNNISTVFISSSHRQAADDALKSLVDNDVSIYFSLEEIVGFQTDCQMFSQLGIYQSIGIKSHTFSVQQGIYMRVKRVLDLIIGLFGIVITGIVGIFIKIDYLAHGDTSPIIYSHYRVGLNGELIKVYKFRSMVPNADEVLMEMLEDPSIKDEWDKNQKLENDPRITSVGRRIRKLSIDELPQFINILNGSMSLIGPRPLVPNELENHDGLKIYTKVKPGLTGWWACNGRSNIEYRERLEMEYYYVRNFGFELDLMCFLRTIKGVIIKEGAR